jgi:predicted dehydrogenase
MIIPVETLTTVFALRRFRSGVEATLSASWDVWKASQPAIEIHGTKGSSQLPHPAWRHGPLRFAGPGGDWQAVAVDDNALTEANWPPDTPSSSNYRGIGLAEMIDAMETGCPHRTPADLATHVVEVADAIIASTTTDTVVSVTSAPQRPAPLDARDISRLISPMP